jgi:hypothetical protein
MDVSAANVASVLFALYRQVPFPVHTVAALASDPPKCHSHCSATKRFHCNPYLFILDERVALSEPLSSFTSAELQRLEEVRISSNYYFSHAFSYHAPMTHCMKFTAHDAPPGPSG